MFKYEYVIIDAEDNNVLAVKNSEEEIKNWLIKLYEEYGDHRDFYWKKIKVCSECLTELKSDLCENCAHINLGRIGKLMMETHKK